jgi:hypothetical protein
MLHKISSKLTYKESWFNDFKTTVHDIPFLSSPVSSFVIFHSNSIESDFPHSCNKSPTLITKLLSFIFAKKI